MTKNPRQARNDRIREYLDTLITPMPTGSIVKTNDLASACSRPRRSVNVRSIGNLLRERDDMVLQNPNVNGVWRKV
jgi:hypothetical protein